MKTKPLVRRARLSDVKNITNLFIESEFLGDKDPSMYCTKTIQAYIRKNVVYIAEIGRKFTGALWMSVYPDYVVTNACAVKKGFERQGVYRALSETRTTHAKRRGIYWIDTMVSTDNKRMRQILTKQGYKSMGLFEAFYQEII